MTTAPIDHKREKLIVLAGLTIFWFISSFVNLVAAQDGPAFSLILLLSAIGWGVGILFWCKIDAEERGEQLTTPLQIVIVGFGIFALIYYLFKTRGREGGVRAIGWLLLYAVSAYLLVVIMATMTVMALKTAGIEVLPQPTPEVSDQ